MSTLTRRMAPPRLSYRAAKLAQSPVGYWQLAEPSGTVARDEMRGMNGTYTNSPTLGAAGLLVGDPAPSVGFTRASPSYVALPTLNMIGWAGASIEAWVKVTTYNPGGSNITTILAYEASGSAKLQFGDATVGGQDYLAAVFGTAGIVSAVHLATNTTYHIAATTDLITIRVYLNGVQVASGAQTGTLPSGTGMIATNPAATTRSTDGFIFAPAIFNRPLSVANINRLYRIGLGIS